MYVSNSHRRGYLLLEVMVAIVLLGIIAISILPTLNFMLRRSQRSTADSQASLVLQAGMEATYHIFLNNWTAYPDGRYKLVTDLSLPNGPAWALSALASGEDQLVQAKYHRVIQIDPVNRDSNTGAQGSGSPDPNSRTVTTTVFWDDAGQTKTITAQLLLVHLTK